MKAYVRLSSENQDVEMQEVAVPKLSEDEVLVQVKAFGVGIHDRYFIPSKVKFPYVIGSEGAGIIMETGKNISDFSIGDRVIFTTILQPQGGSWAEYAVSKQSALIALPENISFAEGAVIPIAGKTAIESIRSLQLQNGAKLFIAGASGAIGTLVIQMATAEGIHVAASASEKNHTYMKDLGAQKTVDYHDPKWIDQINEWAQEGVDAALAIQPGTGQDSMQVVKNNGRLITVSGDSAHVVPVRGIVVEQMGHSSDSEDLMRNLVQDISEEKIKLVIEREYDFALALKALEKTETRHARGKVVVKL